MVVEVLGQVDWMTCLPISRTIPISTSSMIWGLLLVLHLNQLSQPRKRKRSRTRMSKKKMMTLTGTV